MWPIVAIFGIGIGSVTTILLFVPADDPQSRSVILAIMGMLTPMLAALYVKQSNDKKADEVKETLDAREADQDELRRLDDYY